MKARRIIITLIVVSFLPFMLFANNPERPSEEEIRQFIKGTLPSEQQNDRVAKWMIKHKSEVLPVLFETEVNEKNSLAVSAKYGAIAACTTKGNAQSVIDRLLQPETPDISKTTALEIAEKYGFKGERYRSVLLEVLSTTEYGGLQKTLLELLRTYGREEDAELVLEVFKNTDNSDIKSVASDTLLAIGGSDIIGPWEEFWREWKEKEPERQRKKREKEEKTAKEIGVELPPRPESKFAESIDKDIQSLKEKVKSDRPSSQGADKPERENLQGEEDAHRDHTERTDEDHAQTFDLIGLPLLIALAAIIAITAFFIFARKRNA